jgi:outer membrane autotransporter protein
LDGRPGVNVWAGAVGDQIEVDGADGLDSRTVGLVGGADVAMGDAMSTSLIGLAGAWTETDTDTAANAAADATGGHVGLYGAHERGAFSLAGSVAYSWFGFDLSRNVAGATATAEPDGDAFSGYLQAAYDVADRFGAPNLQVAPTVRVNAVTADRQGYVESGAGLLNLTVEEDVFSQMTPAVGLSLGGSFAAGALLLKPEVQVLYEHVFGASEELSTSHIPVAAADFETTVSAGADDRLAVGAGLAASFSDRLTGSVAYDGAFGEDTRQHHGSVDLSLTF